MHIPDGYLSPQTYGVMYAVMVPIWYRASHQVRKSLSKKQLPFMAVGSAFSFLLMLFDIPVPFGASGHMMGGAVLAIAIGPYAAFICMSTTIIIQALIFGDGGITAIAVNCFTMAFVMPFSAHYVYRSIAGREAEFGLRQRISAFLAGYISIFLTAVCTGIILGIQSLTSSPGGQSTYAIYPLSTTISVLSGIHLLFIGPIEGLMTSLVMMYLATRGRLFKPELQTVSPLASGVAGK